MTIESRYKKGRRKEWDLTRDLWKYYKITGKRIPASGRGTKKKESDPDVIASDSEEVFAFEVKSAGIDIDVIYIKERDVFSLLDFCLKFGASPWLAARFYRKPFRLARPSWLERTSTGTFKFNISDGKSIRNWK